VAADNNPLARIHELVDEERELRDRLQRREISADEEHARLRDLEVQLDQCWDLLRQRRALRETGGDPREAQIRPPDEVEGYLG
jgi:predicted nuclease with TOPRIM domain